MSLAIDIHEAIRLFRVMEEALRPLGLNREDGLATVMGVAAVALRDAGCTDEEAESFASVVPAVFGVLETDVSVGGPGTVADLN